MLLCLLQVVKPVAVPDVTLACVAATTVHHRARRPSCAVKLPTQDGPTWKVQRHGDRLAPAVGSLQRCFCSRPAYCSRLQALIGAPGTQSVCQNKKQASRAKPQKRGENMKGPQTTDTEGTSTRAPIVKRKWRCSVVEGKITSRCRKAGALLFCSAQ